MTIENINTNEQSKESKNTYAKAVIQEVDDIVSETYNIINDKKKLALNSTDKINTLVDLQWKVKKTIIRLGWHDISDMPNDYPWAPLAIILVIMYDFMKWLSNDNLSKLSYRVDTIEQLIKILKEKEDLWI